MPDDDSTLRRRPPQHRASFVEVPQALQQAVTIREDLEGCSGKLAQAIQQQLGHHSLTTTETYIRKVAVRLELAKMIRTQ